MKTKNWNMTFAAAVLLVAFAMGLPFDSVLAQQDKRELGDKAPEIEVTEWIQGDPIRLADHTGEKVFAIEFWATWCPPCRTSIPHLTEVYEKYKDRGLEVVAITNEESDTVKPFVESQGDEMTYRVAIDGDGKMVSDYMTAFGENGIPHVFVIDTAGDIVWHGHPMDDELETVIEKHLPAESSEDSQE
jgi:thiol-disulfide isomerase/thioredoxin